MTERVIKGIWIHLSTEYWRFLLHHVQKGFVHDEFLERGLLQPHVQRLYGTGSHTRLETDSQSVRKSINRVVILYSFFRHVGSKAKESELSARSCALHDVWSQLSFLPRRYNSHQSDHYKLDSCRTQEIFRPSPYYTRLVNRIIAQVGWNSRVRLNPTDASSGVSRLDICLKKIIKWFILTEPKSENMCFF